MFEGSEARWKWSLQLFSLFINKLTNEIRAKDLHGIQLSPVSIQLFLFYFQTTLLYCLIGLQSQLNILYKTAKHLEVVVTMKKSNVVIFMNVGHKLLLEKKNDITMVQN